MKNGKKNTTNPSRRSFLIMLIGLPLGISAVKKLFSEKNKEKKLLLDVFAIAGYQFYEGESVEQQLKSGDSLKLNAEPRNPHDEFAVEILTKNNVKLGYVPKNDNKALIRLLQQSTKVEANIEEIDLEEVSWLRLWVGVRLLV